MVTLKINGKEHTINIESDTPLLWAIRDTVNLTGTKYGCGIQQCGACTVLIAKRPVRSCGITVGEVGDKDIDRGMLNLCRCGTYTRVRKAIHRASELMKEVS